jgi:hypothetical protein
MAATHSRHLLRVSVGVVGLAIGLTSIEARAHFVLQAPACWMSQDVSGMPEKMGPCGDEGGGTATGTISAFQSGQMITITINEVIFHPGHYRIALALNDRSQLPAEPTVTAADSPCGSVPIQDPPVFPVLADGVFVHTAAFTAPQTIQVKLPDNVTCDKCTLQVLEFMGEHDVIPPGGCFYHHCADISIQSTAVPVTSDLGTSTGHDLGTGTTSGKHSGCSVGAGAASSAGAALFFGALLLVLSRRRRSA